MGERLRHLKKVYNYFWKSIQNSNDPKGQLRLVKIESLDNFQKK